MRFNGHPRGLAGSCGSSQNSFFIGRHALRETRCFDDTCFDARVLDSLLDFPSKELSELLRGAFTEFGRKETLAGTYHNLHSRLSRDLFDETNIAPGLRGSQVNDSVYAYIPCCFEFIDHVGNGALPAAEYL